MVHNVRIAGVTNPLTNAVQVKALSRDRKRLLVALVGAVSMSLVSTACSGVTLPQIGQAAASPAASNATVAPAGNNAGGTPGLNGGRFNPRETPAPELPTTQPVVTGLFVRRDGANLYVGTGFGLGQGQGRGPGRGQPPRANGAVGTRRAPNNGVPFAYNGPTIEVITNSSTKLYKDVTVMNFQNRPGNRGNGNPLQQQVQAVTSLDDLIGANAIDGVMTVWGTKNGNQITAAVIVYRPRQGPPETPTPASS